MHTGMCALIMLDCPLACWFYHAHTKSTHTYTHIHIDRQTQGFSKLAGLQAPQAYEARALIGPRLGVTFIVLTEGIRGRHSKAEVISSPLFSMSNHQAPQWRRHVRDAISCIPKLVREGQNCLKPRSGCLALTSVGSLWVCVYARLYVYFVFSVLAVGSTRGAPENCKMVQIGSQLYSAWCDLPLSH